MTIDDTALGLENARRIPSGYFTNTALVWAKYMDNEWLVVSRKSVESIPCTSIKPAPNLSEILYEIYIINPNTKVNIDINIESAFEIYFELMKKYSDKKWFWMMDYCKSNSLPPAQSWAWDKAKGAWVVYMSKYKGQLYNNNPPKWCKVGQDVYLDDKKMHDEYKLFPYIGRQTITKIEDEYIYITSPEKNKGLKVDNYTYLIPAIFEPLSVHDLVDKLPFTIKSKITDSIYHCVNYRGDGEFTVEKDSICSLESYLDVCILCRDFTFEDGAPLGTYRAATDEEIKEMS